MRERHPIDDLFRQGLANAEASPPSGILEGVMHQRSRGRHQLLRLRRRWPLLVALLCCGGGATWYAASSPVPRYTYSANPTSNTQPEDSASRTTDPETPALSAVSTRPYVKPTAPSEPATLVADKEGGAVPTTRGSNGTATASEEASAGRTEKTRRTPDFTGKNVIKEYSRPFIGDVVGHTNGTSRTESVDLTAPVLALVTGVPADGGQRPLSDHDPIHMEPWKSLRSNGIPPSTTRSATPPADYVLPHGEWWVGAGVGVYSVERRWSGENEQLVAAWRGSEGKKRDLLYGLYFGRAWRSGIWCGSGIEFGQGRASFDHMDQRQDLTTEVTTQLATFDELVIAVVSDTTVIVEERSERFTGTNRSSVFRIPLMAGWRWSARRWELGVHVGMAGEWHTLRDGYVLMTSANDADVETLSTEQLPEKDRSYGLLSAQVGMGAGFHISEHWKVTAGPGYQFGVSLFSSHAPLQALPGRLGGMVQLTYALPSRTR